MKLAEQILMGDESALSQGITLLENTLTHNQEEAEKLISYCLPYSGNSIRIGITGVPGVGKSTFIESFGKLLTNKGNKVAVLAIDPTSERTQGSILGDKSRMNELANDKNAFIRPSPSGGTLGGITRTTRESIILCEAAKFNIVLIETVGVGQAETTVSNIVDFFLLLMLAGAGDELQGIKRGIMELADALVITKADGNNIQKSKNAMMEYKNALHLFPNNDNGWIPQVKTCSSLENTGIKDIWQLIEKHNKQMKSNGFLIKNREYQETYWLHQHIKEELGNKKYQTLKTKGKINKLESKLQKKESTLYQLLKEL